MGSEPQRIYAIGDIHGCAAELELLLQKLPLSAETLVVFLGDYVDRGGQSRQVIDLILDLRKKVPVVTLMGNHEALLLDFLFHPESAGAGVFILNGGSATLVSYQTEPGRFEIPEEHRRFFQELKFYHATSDYFFVHAGVPDLPLEELSLKEHAGHMLWIRSPFLTSRFRWSRKIIHGHSPTAEPEFLENRINIDTGCVYNGRLSALELPSGRVFSVEKQDKSEEPVFLRDYSNPARVATRFHGALRVTIRHGERTLNFETLNYNQFGLLIRETVRPLEREVPSLQVGDVISGVIGTQELVEMHFRGTVVRTESRDMDVFYGIKMESLIAPGDSLSDEGGS